MKKFLSVLLTAVMTMALLLTGCSSGSSDDASGSADSGSGSSKTDVKDPSEVKIALLLVGTINDYGWSQAGYEGVQEAADEYGFEFAYSESVALADMETTLRDYASQGYDLIIAHGDEFSDAVTTVAEEFPEVNFAITNGSPTTNLDNAIGMDIRNEEQGYIAGYALGVLTESGKVGFIGSVEGTSQKRVQSGFEQGLAAANPDAEAMISYVGSYSDTAAAKEQATAQIEQGADVLFQYAQGAGIGVVQAAAEQGVKIVVTSPSQAEMAPGYAAFAVQTVNKNLIKQLIDAYMDGEFGPDLVVEGTFATEIFQINSIDNSVITEEQMSQVQEQVDALVDGSLKLETRQMD